MKNPEAEYIQKALGNARDTWARCQTKVQPKGF